MTNPSDYPRQAEEAFNRRDLDGLTALWADDFHYRAPGDETFTREAGRTREQRLLEAFPDIHADLGRHFAAGNVLLVEGVLSGTHLGTLALGDVTLGATGRRITVEFAAVFEISAGVARSERIYFDRLGLLEQLGTAAAR